MAEEEQVCSSPCTEQPYIIDSTNLCEYYKKIGPVQIKEDVELLKIASIRERYQLIASDCIHYVSLIENYKEENLQNLCQMVIRRIEGHMIVKFRLNASDRWTEIGFYDDDNTDKETIEEVKRMINLRLKDQSQTNEDRRAHLLAQFEEGERHEKTPPSTMSKAIPDDYFANTDLKPTQEQLESAGYAPVPEHLKQVQSQLVEGTDSSFDLSKFVSAPSHKIPTPPPIAPQEPLSTSSHVDDFKDTIHKHVHAKITDKKDNSEILVQLKSMISEGDQKPFEDLTDNIKSHQQMLDIFKSLGVLSQTLPRSYGSYIQRFATQIVDTQEPDLIANVILDLITQLQVYQILTPNQAEICRKYGIDPTQ